MIKLHPCSVDFYKQNTSSGLCSHNIYDYLNTKHGDRCYSLRIDLNGFLEKKLTKKLGAKHFRFDGEFEFDGWCFDVNGEYFFILTAPVKGTCYESSQPNNTLNASQNEIEFADYLDANILN